VDNKNCSVMVSRASLRGLPITVYTTLVGMKMRDVELLQGLSFKDFCIHLPDKQGFAKIPITDEYLAVLTACFTTVQTSRGIAYSLFGELDDRVKAIVGDKVGVPANYMVSRSGLLSDYGLRVDKTGPVRCLCVGESEVLDHNVLLPDGRVVVCCMDFGMKYVLGNLLKQEYESLFVGKVADDIRQGLRGKSQILCHKCEYGVRNI